MKKFLATAVSGTALLMFSTASAATVVGGTTAFEIQDDLPFSVAVLNGGRGPLGDENNIFEIDITGGDFDLESLLGTIRHDTAEVEFSRDGDSVTISNIVIDTEVETVFGDVSGDGIGEMNFALLDFDIDNEDFEESDFTELDDPALSTAFTEQAALLFGDVFGEFDPENEGFGELASAPEIPLPAGAWLFASGTAGFFMRRKLKKNAA